MEKTAEIKKKTKKIKAGNTKGLYIILADFSKTILTAQIIVKKLTEKISNNCFGNSKASEVIGRKNRGIKKASRIIPHSIIVERVLIIKNSIS